MCSEDLLRHPHLAGDVAAAVAILDALPDANRCVARYLLAKEDADGIDGREVSRI
ncbi:hypothetical protein H9P43_002460 [Blastocladiella emersonii ATCC 22665]|nr:hypothetical protein H9P43_002460 [Blastocladiella emersonii ATCC 22665]